MVRYGDRRFLSHKTAFNVVLGFILASMLARVVNGTAAFFPALGAGFVLVLLHRGLAAWARRSHAVGLMVKGRTDALACSTSGRPNGSVSADTTWSTICDPTGT
jgi:hypothetical protein